jgi:nitroimidazol reductase NimA-like FMN-containing flavoprotein (pyridoxamine 5'-phosphate oxidase superfamily)
VPEALRPDWRRRRRPINNNDCTGDLLAANAPSKRTRIRRQPDLAQYDRGVVDAIIDASYICHVGFADASGIHCIPTACWRIGEHLYIHGSNGGRLMRQLSKGGQACVAITHLDGLVLARSAFNHSMNYRSAMVYGTFEVVALPADKVVALDALMDKLAPGRKLEARPGNRRELGATLVLRMRLDETVAKVSAGGPEDDDADLLLPVWAGVLPLRQVQEAALPAPDNRAAAPAYVTRWAS